MERVPDGPVLSATREALAAAERLQTPAGALALHLADQLDRGRHTGSQVASLSKELRATLDAALDGASRTDGLDEVAERRRAKLLAAGGA